MKSIAIVKILGIWCAMWPNEAWTEAGRAIRRPKNRDNGDEEGTCGALTTCVKQCLAEADTQSKPSLDNPWKKFFDHEMKWHRSPQHFKPGMDLAESQSVSGEEPSKMPRQMGESMPKMPQNGSGKSKMPKNGKRGSKMPKITKKKHKTPKIGHSKGMSEEGPRMPPNGYGKGMSEEGHRMPPNGHSEEEMSGEESPKMPKNGKRMPKMPKNGYGKGMSQEGLAIPQNGNGEEMSQEIPKMPKNGKNKLNMGVWNAKSVEEDEGKKGGGKEEPEWNWQWDWKINGENSQKDHKWKKSGRNPKF